MIIYTRFVLMEHIIHSLKHLDIRFKIGNDKWESFAIIHNIPTENKKTLAIRTKIHNEDSALFTGKIKGGRITKIDSGKCEILKYKIRKHIVIRFLGKHLEGLYHFVDVKNKEDQYLFFKGKIK